LCGEPNNLDTGSRFKPGTGFAGMTLKGSIKGTAQYRKENIMQPTWLLAGWLIDGTGGPIRHNVVIKISGGSIVELDQTETTLESFMQKKTADLFDFSEYTVVPGLVDSHVHLSMSGTEDPKVRQRQLEAEFEEIEPVISKHVQSHLDNGIVAVRDAADHLGRVMHYKTQCLESKKMPIHLKVAGKGWFKQDRYGKMIGRSPQKGETLAMAIQRDLDEIYPKKPDHLKIVNSGINSLVNFGRQMSPQFNPEEMKEAVKIAADHGLPVMVHANGYEPVKIAVEAGCRSIEHGFFIGEDNLKRMADQGTFWVPTVCTMKGYVETLEAGSDQAINAKKYLDHQVEQMALGKKLGVLMATGTDSGSMGVHHGPGLLEELRLFVKAGFNIEEAICCASANGAALLGIESIGNISPSKEASFLAIKGSPDNLPDNFDQHHVVFFKGDRWTVSRVP
jgi:imidazolonepropionase-like amidohydrolase